MIYEDCKRICGEAWDEDFKYPKIDRCKKILVLHTLFFKCVI